MGEMEILFSHILLNLAHPFFDRGGPFRASTDRKGESAQGHTWHRWANSFDDGNLIHENAYPLVGIGTEKMPFLFE
jgi:hypothetical protein